MILPHTQAHLAGPLAAFAARMAATAHLPDDQLQVLPRSVLGPSRPLPRQLRPPPRPSRQFARELSTQVARDRRLSPRCAALAAVLVAQAGKGTLASISRRYLAMVLQVSTRTVARLLAELRAYGYIATTHRLGTLGQTIGLRVELLDPLLPYFDRAVTELSPLVIPKIHKVSEKPALTHAWENAPALGQGLQQVPFGPASPYGAGRAPPGLTDRS